MISISKLVKNHSSFTLVLHMQNCLWLTQLGMSTLKLLMANKIMYVYFIYIIWEFIKNPRTFCSKKISFLKGKNENLPKYYICQYGYIENWLIVLTMTCLECPWTRIHTLCGYLWTLCDAPRSRTIQNLIKLQSNTLILNVVWHSSTYMCHWGKSTHWKMHY